MRFYDIKSKPFRIYGVKFDKNEGKFTRMDPKVAKTVSENVSTLCFNTSGGRVKFSTDSEEIAVRLTYEKKEFYPHISELGTIGCVLSEETETGERFAHSFYPGCLYNLSAEKLENGYEVKAKVGDGTMKNYVLYFPNYNDVKSIEIGVLDNATVKEGKPYKLPLPILYYGSSITQGACAGRPDTCYTALISKWNGIDYKNLGFSGSALGEKEIADYLAEEKCCLFVCDYDYNAPTAEHLKNTHYRLYETFRKKNPDVPILFVTAAYTPNGHREIEERVAVIKNTYKTAKKNGDKNVYFLDGRTFFNKDDYGIVTVEGLHPNDTGFYFMAKAIYKAMCKIDKKFM